MLYRAVCVCVGHGVGREWRGGVGRGGEGIVYEGFSSPIRSEEGGG